MFKKVILAAMIFACASFAETSSSLDIKVGGRAAFNYGTVRGDNTDKFYFDWGAGFTGGLDAKFAVSPTLSIVAGLEIDYRRIGWDIAKLYQQYVQPQYNSYSRYDDDDISNMEYTFALTYFDIPVLARIYPVQQFYIDLGLSIGFNISSTIEVDAGMRSGSVDTPSQLQEDFDFALLAGVGFAALPNLDVYARFSLGFTDMIDIVKFASLAEEDVDYSDAPSIGFKNTRFQLGLTFWFN